MSLNLPGISDDKKMLLRKGGHFLFKNLFQVAQAIGA
jgi:hypothetical protein